MTWQWGYYSVQTGSKDKYDDVIDRREDLFPQQYMLFQVAAAVGIRADKRKQVTDPKDDLVKSSTDAFDPKGVFGSILYVRHPNMPEDERLKILEEYAEYGIDVIHDQLTKTGTIDLEKYI